MAILDGGPIFDIEELFTEELLLNDGDDSILADDEEGCKLCVGEMRAVKRLVLPLGEVVACKEQVGEAGGDLKLES